MSYMFQLVSATFFGALQRTVYFLLSVQTFLLNYRFFKIEILHGCHLEVRCREKCPEEHFLPRLPRPPSGDADPESQEEV